MSPSSTTMGEQAKDWARQTVRHVAAEKVEAVNAVDEVFDNTLQAAKNGDGRAFETLYHQFAYRIAAYARVRGVRGQEPEDVANEVLLRVFENIGGFTGGRSSFTSWVFTISHNVVIDLGRASQRRPDVVGSRVPEQPTRTAEAVAIGNLTMHDLLAVISDLPEAQRDVVVLRLISDLSLREVSVTLGKPVSAVKSLQARGLRRLADILTD